MIDGTGREFDDELTHFLEWYLDAGNKIYVPLEDSIHFVEGVTGITIYRHEQFQVQLFSCTPSTEIPPHKHPNVDSYEVSLRGMEFDLHGETVLPMWWAMKPQPNSNLANEWYNRLRVLPDSLHAARSHETGGAFMSVQHWLNDVKPTSVGNDWGEGDNTMGKEHSSQVVTSIEQEAA